MRRNITYVIGILMAKCPGPVYTTIAMCVVIGAIAPVPIYLIKRIIEAVTSLRSGELLNSSLPIAFVGALGCYFGIVSIMEVASERLTTRMGHVLSEELGLRIYEKTSLIPLAAFDEAHIHSQIQRAVDGYLGRSTMLVSNIIGSAGSVVMYASILGLIATTRLDVVAIIIATNCPLIWVNHRMSNRQYELECAVAPINLQCIHMGRVLSAREYAAELRTFRSEAYLIMKWRRLRSRIAALILEFVAIKTRDLTAARLIGFGGLVGALCLLVYDGVKGVVSLGDMVMLIMAVQRLHGSTSGTFRSVAGLFADATFISDIRELTSVPELHDGTAHAQSVSNIGSLEQRIESIGVRAVTFKYPNAAIPVLNNISISIARGDICVVRGVNGSGKSTLLKLLAGLYEPCVGDIYYNRRDHCVIQTDQHSVGVTALLQDYGRYFLSVRDNVLFGADTKYSDAEILQVLELVNMPCQMPTYAAGLSTRLGMMYEDGVDLSGGQWKKLALARALLRKDAQILVLDEPFNELDNGTRARVMNYLVATKLQRITIIATHDDIIHKCADVVYEIAGGEVHVIERRRDRAFCGCELPLR